MFVWGKNIPKGGQGDFIPLQVQDSVLQNAP